MGIPIGDLMKVENGTNSKIYFSIGTKG